jgi:hypothetical protein
VVIEKMHLFKVSGALEKQPEFSIEDIEVQGVSLFLSEFQKPKSFCCFFYADF